MSKFAVTGSVQVAVNSKYHRVQKVNFVRIAVYFSLFLDRDLFKQIRNHLNYSRSNIGIEYR